MSEKKHAFEVALCSGTKGYAKLHTETHVTRVLWTEDDPTVDEVAQLIAEAILALDASSAKYAGVAVSVCGILSAPRGTGMKGGV